ncbi:MAG: hypothetical protein H6714_09545 [Myxococcales bacterium]|nr:hypothetical protein [Myxococcales bacterium]
MRFWYAIGAGALLSVGCSRSIDLSNKHCPCVAGYVCDPVTNLCVAEGDSGLTDIKTNESDADAPDLNVPIQLALGRTHTCATMEDGQVFCWGSAIYGQLGYGRGNPPPIGGNIYDIGDNEPANAGGPVSLGGNAIQVAAGWHHNCALLDDNTVRCWGIGSLGRLGYGFPTDDIGDDEVPSDVGTVALGNTALEVAAGGSHSCALLNNNGKVRCWGSAALGQLGYGDTNAIGDSPGEFPSSTGPVVFDPPFSQMKEVKTGGAHSCARAANGTVWCWGAGASGQLGHGNTNNIGDNDSTSVIDAVPVGDTVIQLALGGDHTCAILSGGAIRCWGRNDYGQLGYRDTENRGDSETPSGTVDIGGQATQITAGLSHTCALLEGGDVRCWGKGSGGRLGYGDSNNIGDNEHPSAVSPVSLGGSAVFIAAGEEHTCAILNDGLIRCWGTGTDGRLGYGNTKDIGDNEKPSSIDAIDIRLPHD